MTPGADYGESMADKRARWVREGRCRDCGAPGPHRLPDGTTSKRCARCRRKGSRAAGGPRERAVRVALTAEDARHLDRIRRHFAALDPDSAPRSDAETMRFAVAVLVRRLDRERDGSD